MRIFVSVTTIWRLTEWVQHQLQEWDPAMDQWQMDEFRGFVRQQQPNRTTVLHIASIRTNPSVVVWWSSSPSSAARTSYWIEFGGIESTDHEHRNRMGWLTKGLVWYERKRDLQEAADVERRRAQFVRECHFVIDRCEWLSGTSNRSTCGRMTHGRTTCYRSRSEFVAVGIWISIFRRGISSLAWEYWYSVKY